MNIEEDIKKRIEEMKSLIEKINDKSTLAYLNGLYSLKCDYETIGHIENACNYAGIIVTILQHGFIHYDKTIQNNELVNKIWVTSYDTMARNGNFDAFCIAMEWNRPINKQFYLPRKRLLVKHGVIQGIQDLIDDKLDLLVLNLPPRIGKTTVGLFLLTLLGGMCPDESILGAGHSVGLIQSFYGEIMNLMNDEEYRYREIFPNNHIVDKSSEYYYIDLNKKKRFHTYNYVSVEAGGTGKVQAERLLYCDDLIKNVEQANNPQTLEKLYYNYTSTIKDRKIQRLCKDGVYRPCPEIHINTPWSINDVTSRVVRNAEEKGNLDRVRIISVPCYDENGESNFMYDYGKGFDKEYYRDMEIAEDPVIFSAKYLMKPIEREGRPFTEDQLTFFYDLPDEKPDRIVAYNDVAHGGKDYMAMPIGYEYGNEVYIEDVLYVNKKDPDKTRPLVCDKLIQHNVKRAGFEENNGGREYADLIIGDLKRRQYRCNITTHKVPTTKSKRDRILSCGSEIKGIATEFGTYRLYFKAYEKRKDNVQYCEFMRDMYNWSQEDGRIQETQQDGSPDSCAGMITNVLSGKRSGVAKSNINASSLGI